MLITEKNQMIVLIRFLRNVFVREKVSFCATSYSSFFFPYQSGEPITTAISLLTITPLAQLYQPPGHITSVIDHFNPTIIRSCGKYTSICTSLSIFFRHQFLKLWFSSFADYGQVLSIFTDLLLRFPPLGHITMQCVLFVRLLTEIRLQHSTAKENHSIYN